MFRTELSGVAYERYLHKQRDLERVVLAYLVEHPDESVSIDRLLARQRSDACILYLVLSHIRQWGYIAVDPQQTVTITAAGRDRLKRLQRWQ